MVQQVDKKLAQLDKRRAQLARTFDACTLRLRSGTHLGQDRYFRHYWSLAHVTPPHTLLVEAGSSASATSVYMSSDARLTLPDAACKLQLAVAQCMESMLTHCVEQSTTVCAAKKSEEAEADAYKHLIVASSTATSSSGDPFAIALRTDVEHEEIARLTFNQLELLVKRHLQHSQPQSVDAAYLDVRGIRMTADTDTTTSATANSAASIVGCPAGSSKWWLCAGDEATLRRLCESMSRRGYRERHLARGLQLKLHHHQASDHQQHQPSSSASSSMFADLLASRRLASTVAVCKKEEEAHKDDTKMRVSAGDSFDSFYARQTRRFVHEARNSTLAEREKTRVLKLVYDLETRVFNANLQQPSPSGSASKNGVNVNGNTYNNDDDDDDDDLVLARQRLLELEARIERRYLKYPFAPRKKLRILASSTSTRYCFELFWHFV